MPTYYLGCSNGHQFLDYVHSIYTPHPQCPTCGEPLDNLWLPYSPQIDGDEIDIEIRHGICNPDGSPRRFRSKSELKRVAYDTGYSVHGDTPNPNPRIVEQRQMEKESRRSRR
jgi:hypothetical protein